MTRPLIGETLSRQPRPLCILLADDNALCREAVAGRLEADGCTVVQVGDGSEALAVAGRESFDVILLDLSMPGMDGFDTAVAIRAIGVRDDRRPPIVAMTAQAQQGVRERCAAVGIEACVVKPVRTGTLLSIINRALLGREIRGIQQQRPGDDGLVLDRVELMELVGHDEDLLNRMIVQFRAEYPPLLENLRRAAANGQRQAIRRLAHMLRGMIACLAAGASLHAVGRVEAIAAIGEGDMQTALQALETEILRLDNELATSLD